MPDDNNNETFGGKKWNSQLKIHWILNNDCWAGLGSAAGAESWTMDINVYKFLFRVFAFLKNKIIPRKKLYSRIYDIEELYKVKS